MAGPKFKIVKQRTQQNLNDFVDFVDYVDYVNIKINQQSWRLRHVIKKNKIHNFVEIKKKTYMKTIYFVDFIKNI